jgi:putative spermidine/putrescine transport system permease protein
MPLKGDKGLGVETQFGAAGAFESEAAISMIVRHLLGHRRAYYAPMPATLSASAQGRRTEEAFGGASRSVASPTYAAWSKGRLHVTLTMATYDLIHLLQLLGAAAGSATRRPPAIAAAIPAHTTSIDPASHQDRLAKPCEYPWPAWDDGPLSTLWLLAAMVRGPLEHGDRCARNETGPRRRGLDEPLARALVAMVGAVIAGVLAAFGVHRFRFPGRAVVRQVFLLPLLFPRVVVGIGLLVWFSQIGGVPTWLRLVAGHFILTLPYVIITVTASLEMLDGRLEEAAMNLGANSAKTFQYITLPIIKSGIVSGAIFAWLVSFSNFTVSFFLYSGEVTPLPPWLFEVMQHFVDPSVAALSTFLVAITLAVLVIINRMFSVGRLVGLRR